MGFAVFGLLWGWFRWRPVCADEGRFVMVDGEGRDGTCGLLDLR